jgi:hypothetical protein
VLLLNPLSLLDLFKFTPHYQTAHLTLLHIPPAPLQKAHPPILLIRTSPGNQPTSLPNSPVSIPISPLMFPLQFNPISPPPPLLRPPFHHHLPLPYRQMFWVRFYLKRKVIDIEDEAPLASFKKSKLQKPSVQGFILQV